MHDRAREALISEIISEFSQSFAAARTRWARFAEEIHPELHGPGMMMLQTILRRGPVTATSLGSLLDMDKAMVSRQVTKLRSLGLVDAKAAASDRRVILLTASDAAHAAIAGMHARAAADYLARFTDWDETEIAKLQALLHRFNAAAEEAPGEGPARRCAREERGTTETADDAATVADAKRHEEPPCCRANLYSPE